jgi:transcriptional regulator with XRE-family HTH domain
MPLNLKKLKSRREELGLSQEDAAAEAEMKGRQAWYNIESGRQANVTVETLEKIAKALKVSPCDLLTKP